jgi:fatty acid/phospholipid biosynthesis enzyme
VGIIAHGASSSKAIKNAILVAKEFVGYQVNKHIVESLKNYA